MQALEVRRVTASSDLLHPGDYVFIPKREPEIRIERCPLTPPTGFFRRAIWFMFGKKTELKQIVELRWPEYDTIILNCPVCAQPMGMPKTNKIISVEPLTLEIALTCPYCITKTFDIKEGKLMTA